MDNTKEQKTFVTCEYCKASVRDSNMQFHLAKAHNINAKEKTIKSDATPEADSEERNVKRTEKTGMIYDVSDRENERKYWFLCKKCDRKSMLATGQITVAMIDNEHVFFYNNEIKCRHCNSSEVEMIKIDIGRLMLRMILAMKRKQDDKTQENEPPEFIVVGETGFVDGKRMHRNEAIPYFEKMTAEGRMDWEKWIRYGNILCFHNRYDDAIPALKKANELNKTALAPHMTLGKIYFHRWKEYGEAGAKKEATIHLVEALTLIENGKYDMKTIRDDTTEGTAQVAVEMLDEMGALGKEVLAAPMEEIEKPLSVHTIDNRIGDNVVIRQSSYEKIAGETERAIRSVLYKKPEMKKSEIMVEIKELADDFDRNDISETGRWIRNRIKLFLINEKKKRGYSKEDVTAGLLFILTMLESENDYFNKLIKATQRCTDNFV